MIAVILIVLLGPGAPDRSAEPEEIDQEAAGNVISAVALADLSVEEITYGLERVARDAAWDIGLELENDIYRARRRR